jgi:hypothetical protein
LASTDQPTTFGELTTALLDVTRENTGSAALEVLAQRYLNQANQDLHQERWWWAERVGRLELHAAYTTGTVALALADRTAVTGTDTLWNTTVTGMGFANVRAGGKLVFAGAHDVYPVASVTSDTALTLAEPFVGDTALSGATYTYFEDEYALPSDFDDEHGLEDAITFQEARTLTVLPRAQFRLAYPRNHRPSATLRHATLIHLGPSGSVDRRPRVVFGPPPLVTRTMPFTYYTKHLAVSSVGAGAEHLSADADEPIVPAKWRMALVYKAAELWMLDRKSDPRASEYKARYEALILRARTSADQADARPTVVPAGTYWPARAGRGPLAGRRYSTGTEFEAGWG